MKLCSCFTLVSIWALLVRFWSQLEMSLLECTCMFPSHLCFLFKCEICSNIITVCNIVGSLMLSNWTASFPFTPLPCALEHSVQKTKRSWYIYLELSKTSKEVMLSSPQRWGPLNSSISRTARQQFHLLEKCKQELHPSPNLKTTTQGF